VAHQRAEHPTEGGDVSVLTVDDQAVFRGVARDVIEATAGFTSVGEASCGQEALAAVDERKPQLVLVDVRMPGMDGIETANRIKDAHADVVVVLISVEDPANLPAAASSSAAAALVRKQDFGPRMLRGLWVVHGTRG
jgi:two-component system, NarL family, invasion response regulator UvrY